MVKLFLSFIFFFILFLSKGSKDAGVTIKKKNAKFNKLMKKTARILNLAPHMFAFFEYFLLIFHHFQLKKGVVIMAKQCTVQ